MDKHIATRMCAVTKERLPKHMLIRISISEGKLVVDTKGKVRSRGVNIKPNLEILRKAIQQNIFKRVYNMTFTKEDYSILEKDFAAYIETKLGEKNVVRISKSELDNIEKE